MIVVDTNVVSELVKTGRDKRVVAWFHAHLEELALPTPAVAELFAGAEVMAAGKRKTYVIERYREICELFESRVLTFDMTAALTFPKIAIACRDKGRPIDMVDCQIASIAQVHRASVASRDSDFIATGLTIINPWEE